MNKLALFVEGYTEVVFVEKLVEEIAGKNKVLIETRQIRGGGRSGTRRTFAKVKAAKPSNGERYFFMIVDCGNDDLVKGRIQEEHESLTKAGYKKIIGLRDVRPDFSYTEITRLEKGLPYGIRTALAPVEIYLAVMEIESWFLAEATHFPKIDPAITVDAIKTMLGFDPTTEDMELRPTPTDDLKACYAIGGKEYQKRHAQTTIDALDFNLLYYSLQEKFRHMSRLISSIEAFLAS